MSITSWTGFTTERALAWSRVFFDFPPIFPGAGVMALAYQGFRRGTPPGLGWAPFAQAAEDLDFDPDLYYLFRLALRDIPFGREAARWEVRTAPADLTPWAGWAQLVRSGTTPLRAASLIAHPGPHTEVSP